MWFRQPLHWRIIDPDPTGPARMLIQARINLEIEISPGRWHPLPDVRVDTGASMTIISSSWARSVDLPLPDRSHRLGLTTAGGLRELEVYDLDLRVRFPRAREREFTLACVCREEGDTRTTPPLLGLHNLIDSWRIIVDGNFEPAAPMGHLRFESSGPAP